MGHAVLAASLELLTRGNHNEGTKRVSFRGLQWPSRAGYVDHTAKGPCVDFSSSAQLQNQRMSTSESVGRYVDGQKIWRTAASTPIRVRHSALQKKKRKKKTYQSKTPEISMTLKYKYILGMEWNWNWVISLFFRFPLSVPRFSCESNALEIRWSCCSSPSGKPF